MATPTSHDVCILRNTELMRDDTRMRLPLAASRCSNIPSGIPADDEDEMLVHDGG
jgi:hypothetical protein